jgi:hypothetical protein
LYSDHEKLKHLNSQDKLSARHAKWATFLQQFSFTIKHKLGALNKVANALSQDVSTGARGGFVLHNGFLFKGTQLCIPEGSLQLKIIKERHDEGHMGRDKTF